MSQAEKAFRFADLHQKGKPLVLYNIWDTGGAKVLAKEGAPAVATGSWALAAAHGYKDGEAMPLEFFLTIVARICATVDLPVTVDFEGGYAAHPADVAANALKLIRAGAIGLNFEDRVVKGEGLYSISSQVARIRAIKAAAADAGIPLFLNARTDVFLGADPAKHKDSIANAQDREAAYAEAGADCFFVPGLTQPGLISRIVEAAQLPVNVMMMGEEITIEEITALGVSRASFGPAPFLRFQADLKKAFGDIGSCVVDGNE